MYILYRVSGDANRNRSVKAADLNIRLIVAILEAAFD